MIGPHPFGADKILSGLRRASLQRQNKTWLRPVVVMLLAVVVVTGCARSDPEHALRDTIATIQRGIEAGEVSALTEHLATDFIGPGGMDREAARRTSMVLMLRHDRIGLAFGPLEVQLRDARATVRFTAMLSGGSGRLLPDTAQVYAVETGWRLDDDQWLLINATWKPRL